jgi:hypothetical protein
MSGRSIYALIFAVVLIFLWTDRIQIANFILHGAKEEDEKPWYYNHPGQSPTGANAPEQVPKPETPKVFSYSLLPRQSFNMRNTGYRRFVVRSEYPISLTIGNCHADNVVEYRCLGDPADIFVIDDRLNPMFGYPRANVVEIAGLQN